MTENCNYAFYADDTSISVSDTLGADVVNKLQIGLDLIHRYFNKRKIKLKASKTQRIFFTRKIAPCYLPATKLKLNYNYVIHSF